MRTLALAISGLAMACAGVGSRPAFDAARLRLGSFHYRTVLDGSDAGTATITVARLDANRYRFANDVQGQFRQTWESTSTAALEPLSASLGLGASDDKRRTMRLTYQGRSVTGTATNVHSVSAELPGDIVDQRVDWAALMSARLVPGGTIAFSVFDPWTGISPVSARVEGPETVRVPAGTFTVLRVSYRIEKKTRGAETYVAWVTADAPHFLVREDFPNGARSELVSSSSL